MSSKIIAFSTSSQYLPAVLKHLSSGWLIEYYVRHPESQDLQRQRVKLNRFRKRFSNTAQFRLAANEMVCAINTKLAGGWNPFFESDNTRYYTKLSEVISVYLSEKEKELRPATFRTYKSWCSMFNTWCVSNFKDTYASLINKVLAVKYMDYMYSQRNISARAYNNNVKQGRAFFNWCVEKCYVKENPFESLRLKRETEKKRILVPEEWRKRIVTYLSDNNPNFLTMCMLVFGSLIRPKELRQIRIRDVQLSNHCIYIPADVAKNHHARYAAISPQVETAIVNLLKDKRIPETHYLFGIDFLPSATPCPEAKMTKTWDKMRTALRMPQEMQLYSLRDTGINNMLKSGIDPLTVMQHADHHDLAMTTRYANHADEHLIERIVKEAPDF